MSDILYHYCASHTFTSIINNRSLWLSSMSLSNDSMEGRHAIETFMDMVREAAFPAGVIDKIYEALSFFNRQSDGLGFCLSEEGDLLSQWRGYAADGTGISIGFSKDYLKWLGRQPADVNGFAVIQVVYDPVTQKENLKPIFDDISRLISDGAYLGSTLLTRGLLATPDPEEDQKRKKASEQMRLILARIFSCLYAHKSGAFKEEREWRLLNYLLASEECDFRAISDRIIPYRNFELLEPNRHPITEVILGPKHITPAGVIQGFLRTRGFGEVPVRRSISTYR